MLRTRIALPVAGRAAPDPVWARVCTVDQVDGDSLHLVDHRVACRVPAGAVVRRGEAVGCFTRQVEEHPDSAFAHLARAVAHADQGRRDAALADLDAAIRLDPPHVAALGRRAWLLATCPEEEFCDGPGAISAAWRACELTGWVDPNHLTILAAAYAEAGDFAQAIKWQEDASAATDDEGRHQLGEERLADYRAERPYRTDP